MERGVSGKRNEEEGKGDEVEMGGLISEEKGDAWG